MKILLYVILVLATYFASYSQQAIGPRLEIRWSLNRKFSLHDFRGSVDSGKLKEYNSIKNIRKRIIDSLNTNKIKLSELYYPELPHFDSTHTVFDISGYYNICAAQIDYNLYTCYYPKESYSIQNNDFVLISMQIRFNIHELYTRKIKKFLHEMPKKKANREYIDDQISLILTFCSQDVRKFDNDLENSSQKTELLEQWNRKINKELKLLNLYTQPHGKILLK